MTDTVAAWLEAHRTDPVIAYLIEHHTATIAELAAHGNTTIDRMLADMGGLHDHGIVTRYGDKPWSTVRWDYDQRRRWDQLSAKHDAREGNSRDDASDVSG